MPLGSMKEMLNKPKNNGYAVGPFNLSYLKGSRLRDGFLFMHD